MSKPEETGLVYAATVSFGENGERVVRVEVSAAEDEPSPTPDEIRECARALMQLAAAEEGQDSGDLYRVQ